MTVMVHGIFETEKSAAKAVDELIESDFTRDHICVLMRSGAENPKIHELPVDVKSKVAPGIKIGTALGAVGGALVATSGGLLVAGPVLALVQGAVGGGAVGFLAGFVGGLGGMHVEIDTPRETIPDEALLVGVMTDDDERIEVARRALLEAGAPEVRVQRRGAATEALRHTNLQRGLEGPYGLG
jgi:hypothetical protein